jgi:4'-phosphopantetheinyl transferase
VVLRTGIVHVWQIPLDYDATAMSRLAVLLSTDERTRAQRFRFERDARRFVAARGAIRAILAEYLEMAPTSFAFTYAERGKPALAGGELEFNVSHSGEIAMIAVYRGGRVGVDVEAMRPLHDLDALAVRSFAPLELAVLRSLPSAERELAFYRCWTRKEAFIKATGEGLTRALDTFVVTLAPGEPARFLDIDDDPGQLAAWSLHELPTPAGYVGALVVEGHPHAVVTRLWSPGRAHDAR